MGARRILIVDDELSIRVMLTRMIEPLRHEVFTAENGVAALELARTQAIDLVVSDLAMPHMGGLELLERLRQEGNDCAFIILTGYGDLPQALAARERFNISNFLVKPIHNIDQFLFDVESALSRRLLERENRALLSRLQGTNAELESKVRERTGELQEKNRELERLSRFRADVLKVLGHELRTPLAILSGYHALTAGGAAPATLEMTASMGESIRRLQSIVDKSLLLLKSGEATGFPLETSRVSPRELCLSVAERIQSFVTNRRVNLVPPPPCEATRVCEWDCEKIEEVIEELLINAIRASRDGSRIEMDLRSVNGGLELLVRDFGVGVPVGETERIFEPFVTLRNAAHHSSGLFEFGAEGAGIGLSMSRMWVSLHGGTIAVQGNEGYPGTSVRVWLPLDATAARPESEPALEPIGAATPNAGSHP